jgi:hypothetical protein
MKLNPEAVAVPSLHAAMGLELTHALQCRRCPVRSSGISDMWKCPRFFMFKHRLGLQRKGYHEPALYQGGLYHLLNERFYKGESPEKALLAASSFVSEENKKVTAMADATGLMPDGEPVERLIAKREEEFSKVQAFWLASVPVFFNSPIHKSGQYRVKHVERVFSCRVPGISVPLRSKPDAILEDISTGELILVGHKTTSFEPSREAAAQAWGVQPMIERITVQAAYPDVRVVSYLHNILKKPPLKYPAKKYPTFTDYLEACKQWYKDAQAEDPNNPPVLQSLTGFIPTLITPEQYTLLYEAGRAGSARPAPDIYYKNPTACWGRFGRKRCQYHGLCSVDSTQWPDLMASGYKQEWREDNEDAVSDD